MSIHCTRRLTCKICSKSHPTTLHREEGPEQTEQCAEVKSGFTSDAQTKCAMSIVPVTVKAINSDKSVNTYAFLDTGSTASFLSESLMHRLNLTGTGMKFNLSTMSDESKLVNCYSVKDLEVAGLQTKEFIKLPNMYTCSKMPVSRYDIPKQSEFAVWSYLKEVDIPELAEEVDLLIGANVPEATDPYETIHSQGGGPYAVKTILGWSINGPLSSPDGKGVNQVRVNRINVTPSLVDDVQRFHNQDFTERLSEDTTELLREDQRFPTLAERSIRHERGRYIIGLPSKFEDVVLPNNRQQAVQHAAVLLKMFNKQEGFYEEYKTFMENVIAKGYAREVPQDQLDMDNGKVWYLPHHNIYAPSKNELRVVVDCAARFGDQSLSDVLLQGPNPTNNLLGTLLRFRQDNVAVIGDIESMFYQVNVPPEDANFL